MQEASENTSTGIPVAYPKYTIKQYYAESLFARKLFRIIANSHIHYIDNAFTFEPRESLSLHPGHFTMGHYIPQLFGIAEPCQTVSGLLSELKCKGTPKQVQSSASCGQQ